MKGFELLEMHHSKVHSEQAAQKGEDKILKVRKFIEEAVKEDFRMEESSSS